MELLNDKDVQGLELLLQKFNKVKKYIDKLQLPADDVALMKTE
jgi:hypothetical protein